MRKLIKIMLLAVLLLIIGTASITSNEAIKAGTAGNSNSNGVKVLLLMNDGFGSSFRVTEENYDSIIKQFKDFGWNITVAGYADKLLPCPWAKKNFNEKELETDVKLSMITDISEYDALVIMPGRSFKNIIENKKALELIRKAAEKNLIIAAWCRGVRVLAKADVIRGKRIIGNFNHAADYKAAGADYVDYKVIKKDGKRVFVDVVPPIADGNIITTVRSKYYRKAMCDLIKTGVDRRRAKSRK